MRRGSRWRCSKGVSRDWAAENGLPHAWGLLKRAPLLAPALSLVLAGARRPLLRYAVLGAGSALLAWKGYQWLADQRRAAPVPADEGEPPPAP